MKLYRWCDYGQGYYCKRAVGLDDAVLAQTLFHTMHSKYISHIYSDEKISNFFRLFDEKEAAVQFISTELMRLGYTVVTDKLNNLL